jgi:hypothetical protein
VNLTLINNLKTKTKKNQVIKMYDPFGLFGGMMLLILIPVILFYIIGILLAVWVYTDAKKRDMNAAVWLLIVLLTGCCGCIIYLIVRD